MTHVDREPIESREGEYAWLWMPRALLAIHDSTAPDHYGIHADAPAQVGNPLLRRTAGWAPGIGRPPPVAQDVYAQGIDQDTLGAHVAVQHERADIKSPHGDAANGGFDQRAAVGPGPRERRIAHRGNERHTTHLHCGIGQTRCERLDAHHSATVGMSYEIRC